MNESIPSGCMPDRRRPGRVDDDISPERMRRYLPPQFTALVDRMPDPSSPGGRNTWCLVMRYAIWANGQSWFKYQAELRLAELMKLTTAQLLAMAGGTSEFAVRQTEGYTKAPDVTEAKSPEDA